MVLFKMKPTRPLSSTTPSPNPSTTTTIPDLPKAPSTSGALPAPGVSRLSSEQQQGTGPSCLTPLLPRIHNRKTRRTLVLVCPFVFGMLLAAILVPTLLLLTRRAVADDPPGRLGSGTGSYIPSISHLGVSNTISSTTSSEQQDVITADDAADRKTMITLFYPIVQGHCRRTCSVPYMPPATASWANEFFFASSSAVLFDKVTYNACCASAVALDPGKETLVVIEPAAGTSRLLYSGIAQEIASHGFAVLLVDHPSDAGILEWTSADGQSNVTIKASNCAKLPSPLKQLKTWDATIDAAIAARTADIQHIRTRLTDRAFLSSLLPSPAFKLLSSFRPAVSSPAAVIGHGLGGSVAVSLLATKPAEFSLAINLAGTPPLPTQPLQRGRVVDFGLLSTGDNPAVNITRPSDLHWPAVWPKMQSGHAVSYTLMGGDMFDLSDVPGIAALSINSNGNGGQKTKAKGTGSITPWKAFGAVAQMVRAYCIVQFRDGRGQPDWEADEGGRMVQGLRTYFKDEVVPFKPVGGPTHS